MDDATKTRDSDGDPTDAGPHRAQKQPGQDTETPSGQAPDDDDIRPAGPKEMDMPPPGWKKEDEESDESFPASDPPGNY